MGGAAGRSRLKQSTNVDFALSSCRWGEARSDSYLSQVSERASNCRRQVPQVTWEGRCQGPNELCVPLISVMRCQREASGSQRWLGQGWRRREEGDNYPWPGWGGSTAPVSAARAGSSCPRWESRLESGSHTGGLYLSQAPSSGWRPRHLVTGDARDRGCLDAAAFHTPSLDSLSGDT